MIDRQFSGNDPRVMIQLDRDPPMYEPGETLHGEYRFDRAIADQVKRAKILVYWYTEGKGTESSAIHFTETQPSGMHTQFDAHNIGRFETVLPPSPLSYDGQIVKIHWCVRVEVFLADKQRRAGEAFFQLGNVSAFSPIEQHQPF